MKQFFLLRQAQKRIFAQVFVVDIRSFPHVFGPDPAALQVQETVDGNSLLLAHRSGIV